MHEVFIQTENPLAKQGDFVQPVEASDLNPRPLRPEENRKSPIRREWLFIAVSAPRGMLFCGLVSVVSVYFERVYGQRCGQPSCGRYGKINTSYSLMIL